VIDRRLELLGRSGRATRLRTLLPLLRTALLVAIAIVIGLTALSELGVDIAPLLAGAGIVGVAIGFGSQTLVHDVITGMFLLLENEIQVGDVVTAAGFSGTVENLSIRTIRLRAADGSVNIIPFSTVTTINNTSRGIGNATISVTIPYDEDIDRVDGTLKEIVGEKRSRAMGARQGQRVRGDDRRSDRMHRRRPVARSARIQPAHERALPSSRDRDRELLSLRQIVDQGLRSFEVACVEPLHEPFVNGHEKLARFLASRVGLPQPGEARGSTKLP
jgi:hypothetical protein